MPNVVRFVLDSARDLYVPGVGQFVAGVHDVDADNIKAIGRARFLVQPFRAIEIGVVDSETPPPNLPPAPEDIVSIPDPYAQYLLPGELAPAMATVAQGDNAFTTAQRAAFVHLNDEGQLVIVVDGVETVVATGGAGGLTLEEVQDAVASMILAGTNITKVYDDNAGTLTLSAAGGGGATDPEVVRDTIAAALVAGSGVTITKDDAGDTIGISVPDATAAVKGLARFSSNTEATTGTSADRAVTPVALKAVLDARQYTKVTVDGVHQPLVDLPSAPVTAEDVGAIPEEARGAPDGVATLDSTGKVPTAQLPAASGGNVVRAPAVNMSGVGLYTTPVVVSTSTLAMALDTVYACPIAFDVAVTLDLLGLRVTTAGSADNVLQLGLFANAAGRASGAPLLRVAATPSSANSAVEWVINQALAAGVYWLEISSHGGTAPTVRAGTLIGQMALDAASVASANVPAALIQAGYTTSSALPNPMVPTGTATLMPRIYARRSA